MKLQKIFYRCKRVEALPQYCVHWHVENHLSLLSIILIAAIILFPSPTLAQGSTEGLEGFKFGVGLTLTIDAGGRNRVQEAEVVNGIVRITEERDVIPRLMLETHYFFVPKETSFLGILDEKMWGWGPFVGLQNGSPY